MYVPIAGRQMRPYERRRADQIADTVVPGAASSPLSPEPENPIPVVQSPQQTPVASAATSTGTVSGQSVVESIRRPYANRGIWIEFGGRIWLASGAGGPNWPGRFEQIGMYHGFPVYQESGHTDRIYVPAVPGGPVARYSLSNERTTAKEVE